MFTVTISLCHFIHITVIIFNVFKFNVSYSFKSMKQCCYYFYNFNVLIYFIIMFTE